MSMWLSVAALTVVLSLAIVVLAVFRCTFWAFRSAVDKRSLCGGWLLLIAHADLEGLLSVHARV